MNAIKERQRAITDAFEAASDELGIGMGSLEVWKRETLAQIILELANEGCSESGMLASAVARFRAAVLCGPETEQPPSASSQ